MSKSYTYTFYAKDFMSPRVLKIAENTGKAFSKIGAYQAQFKRRNDTIGSSITGLRQKLDKLTEKRDASFSTKQIKKFNTDIRATEKQLRKLENLPPLSFTQRLKNIGREMGGIVGVAGGIGVALGAWSGIKGVIELGAEMEQTKVSFTTMLGSANAAATMVGKLNKLANKTPFSNKEVLTAGKNLIAFGVNAGKVEGTLSRLGDIASGVNIPFNELASIYGKMKVGKIIQMEDINQLAGRGIPVFEYLAKTMGVNETQIRKLSSQGKISFTDLDNAFTLMTQKGGKFNGMMIAQSKTFSGRLSTLKGNFQTLGIAIGEKLLPYAEKFLNVGFKFVEFLPQIPVYFDAIKTTISDNALSFGLIGVAVAALSANMLILKAQTIGYTIAAKAQTLWTKIATAGQWLWNAAMTANPIGLVIAGIAALGAAVVWAYNKVGWFRGGIKAAWEGLKGFAVAIKDLVVGRIKEMINGITGIGRTLMLFFKGEWSAAWEEGKKAAQNLTGIGGEAQKKFVDDMKKTGQKAGLAYHDGVKEVEDKKKLNIAATGKANSLPSVKNPLAEMDIPNNSLTGMANLNNGGNTIANSSAFQNGVNGISEGGKKQTNISVTFEKLIEQLIIKAETVSEGIDDMEDRVKEALMRIMNSTNHLQTQSV